MNKFIEKIDKVADADAIEFIDKYMCLYNRKSLQKLYAAKLIIAAMQESGIPGDLPICDLYERFNDGMSDVFQDYAALALHFYSYNNSAMQMLHNVIPTGDLMITDAFDMLGFMNVGILQAHELVGQGFDDHDYPSVMFYGYLRFELGQPECKEHAEIKEFLHLVNPDFI